MKIQINTEIKQSIDSVWQVMAEDFTKIDQWFKPVLKSYELPNTPALANASCAGRICEFSEKPNGLKASELIEVYDKSKHLLVIEVSILNAPSIFPIKKNIATFQLTTLGTSHTQLTLVAEPDLNFLGKMLSPILKLALKKNFTDISRALKLHCESPLLPLAV
ncbi:hypothetical protein [uncultured Shewanella sp.]|uniref:hypothetical protein n=1 Tax=uncultured Shewanella sp. TaxID=173975 RepID=UPI00262845BC|nr:hypothetical protein [uncultured Shewanella sp.]